ncbi:MAG: c-type cytochrome domain-containing protein [Pirellulaceae bacterium]|nr:hypothetical protein [Planctomycetales bacterium]
MTRLRWPKTFATLVSLLAYWLSFSLAPVPLVDADDAVNNLADQKVEFSTHVLPILQQNCLACHSASEAEGDLNLESVASVQNGSASGPVVTAGKGDESLLWKLAAHLDEPVMPPADNTVGAKRLSDQQLAVLRKWIEQGANHDVEPSSIASPIQWQPVAADRLPIYASAISPEGRYVAAGRGSQIDIRHVGSQEKTQPLIDPSISSRWKLPPAADVDVIQSLAFSPDGQWLASGGFRTIKLWHKTFATTPALRDLGALSTDDFPMKAYDATFQRMLMLDASRQVTIVSLPSNARHDNVTTLPMCQQIAVTGSHLFAQTGDRTLRHFDTETWQPRASIDTSGSITAMTAARGANKLYLAAACDDGKIMIWQWPVPTDASGQDLLANEPYEFGQAQVISHDKGKVSQLTLVLLQQLPDEQPRIATVHDGGGLRLWKLADGSLEREVAVSMSRAERLAEGERKVTLAQQDVAGAEEDKKTAEEALKAEGEAIKTAEEELKQAKAKIAEVTKERDERKQDADTKQKASDENEQQISQLTKERDSAQAALSAASEADDRAALEKNVNDAMAKLQEKEKVREELKKGVVEAKKKLEESEKSLSQAQQDRDASAKLVERSKAAQEAADTTLKERMAALETIKGKLEATQQQQQQLVAAPPSDDDAIIAIGCYCVGDGRIVALRRDGQLEIYGADGTAWERHASPLRSGPVFFVDQQHVIGFDDQQHAADVEMLAHWELAHTIGDPDDTTSLVDRVIALDFSADSRMLASGGGEPSRSGELKIWQMPQSTQTSGDERSGPSLLHTINDAHSDTVLSVAFSPDSGQLATGSADRMCKTFDVASGQFLRAFEGHTHYVQSVGWRADGRRLVTSGGDKAVKVWNPATGQQVNSTSDWSKEIASVAFLGVQDRLAVASGSGQVLTMNPDGKDRKGFNGGDGPFLHTLDATRNGEDVVAAGEDRVIRIWTKDGKIKAEFPPAP